MTVSDYRGNANIAIGQQQSNKSLLMRPVSADRVTIGIISTAIVELARPKIYRWLLIRNFGTFDIWLSYGIPAIVGQGIQVLANDLYFVNPIPTQAVFAIADGGSNNRIYITGY